MMYTQVQILLMVVVFIFELTQVQNLTIECKEMEVLALKEDGNLWAKTYDTMPVTTV